MGTGEKLKRPSLSERRRQAYWVIGAVWAIALLASWMWSNVPGPELARHAGQTVVRFGAGVVCALFVPLLLVLVMQRRVGESSALVSTLSFLDAIPALAWLPLMLLLAPSDEHALVLVTAVGAALPLAIAVTHGISQVERGLEHSARLLGASRAQIWFGVMVPAARPAILAGVRSSIYQAARTIVGAEIIVAAGAGLGQLVAHDSQAARFGGIVATATLIGATVALLDTMVLRRLLDDAEVKWQVRSVDRE